MPENKEPAEIEPEADVRRAPASLKFVALTFFVYGILKYCSFVEQLANDRLFNLSDFVLSLALLYVSWGMLREWPAARTIAKWLLGFLIFFFAVFAILFTVFVLSSDQISIERRDVGGEFFIPGRREGGVELSNSSGTTLGLSINVVKLLLPPEPIEVQSLGARLLLLAIGLAILSAIVGLLVWMFRVLKEAQRLQLAQRKHRRYRIRFRLRTLLILVMAFSVLFGWAKWSLNQLRNQARKEQPTIAWIEEMGGDLTWNSSDELDLRREGWSQPKEGNRFESPVRGVKLNSPEVGDLSTLAGLKSLEHLYLDNTQVNDLSPLTGLKHLRTLSINSPQVSDLSPLAELKSLEDLILFNTQISDLSPLAGLMNLKSLGIHNAPVSDLSPLAGLSNLESLMIDNAPVSELSPLTGLRNLTMLNIYNTQVSDEQLEVLKQTLPSLLNLFRFPPAPNDDALKAIRALGGTVTLNPLTVDFRDHKTLKDSDLDNLSNKVFVQSLILGGTPITDNGLQRLHSLTDLKALDLRECLQISDKGLVHLKNLTNIGVLNIASTMITDEGLRHLSGLTKLQHLHLSNTQVTDAGLANLSGMTNLQLLDLSNTQLADAGLIHLIGLTKLKLLDLSNTQLTDAGLVHLSNLRDLETLDLSRNKIGDEGLSHLKALPNIQNLYLSQNPITDSGIEHLKAMRSLERVYLKDTQVTAEGIKILKIVLPHRSVVF